jgi:hypothetical protein
MTSPVKTESNRRNAANSTGPRTPAGKARSASNAIAHGLRSPAPVLPGERVEDWEAHRSGVVRSLAPAGGLESELADRVALCLWRMRRVAAFETAASAARVEEVQEAAEPLPSSSPFVSDRKADAAAVEKARKAADDRRETVDIWEGSLRLHQDLSNLKDDAPLAGEDVNSLLDDVNAELPGDEYMDTEAGAFLAELGVPADRLKDPWHWGGWTAGFVRRATRLMAVRHQADPDELLAEALASREHIQSEGHAEAARLEVEASRLEERAAERRARRLQRCVLPDQPTLDKIARYESHLGRQMLQALHTLERLQKTRAGEPVPAPAAVDVTVDGVAVPLPADAPAC